MKNLLTLCCLLATGLPAHSAESTSLNTPSLTAINRTVQSTFASKELLLSQNPQPSGTWNGNSANEWGNGGANANAQGGGDGQKMGAGGGVGRCGGHRGGRRRRGMGGGQSTPGATQGGNPNGQE